MKKIMLFFIFCSSFYGQTIDWEKEAKSDMLALKTKMTKLNADYVLYSEKLSEIRKNFSTDSLIYYTNKVKEYNNKIEGLCKTKELLINFYVTKKIDKKSLISFYGKDQCETISTIKTEAPEKPKEDEAKEDLPKTKKFIIIGNEKPIPYDSIFTSHTIANKVIMGVFSAKSEINLGTFQIPKVGQKLMVENFEGKTLSAYFRSIDFEINEGNIVDVRVVLTSVDHKIEYYFENTAPYSLLRYTRFAGSNLLQLSYSKEVGSTKTKSYRMIKKGHGPNINLCDVLSYFPNAGSNYVPENGSYHWPHESKDLKETDYSYQYQIKNNNSLQNIADIRTYTDFTSFFGDEPNGLVQLEAKADFYLNPFNVARSNSFLFKKITPSVRYSRIDEKQNTIDLTNETDKTKALGENSIQLLQKSKLQFGLDLDIFTFKFSKEQPFDGTLYITNFQNITPVSMIKDSIQFNFNTYSFGAGLKFNIKRYSNFGFNVGADLIKHTFIGNYKKYEIDKPENFFTNTTFAEAFYYPSENKEQSIFLRVNSTIIAFGNNDSYYQLQFGYRFTFGLNSLQSK